MDTIRAIKRRGQVDRLFFRLVGNFIVLGGVSISLSGVAFIIFQGWLWLRDGRWTYFSIADGLGEPPRSNWAGVAQIIDWIWAHLFAAGLFVAGFPVMGLAPGVRTG